MINNIIESLKTAWLKEECFEQISVISAPDNKPHQPLVRSDVKIFNFDKITKMIYPNHLDSLPASADGIFLMKDTLYFVEFKTGFKKRITKQNFDPTLMTCPHINLVCGGYLVCGEYRDLFFKNQGNETKLLVDSIKFKAVNSFITFDKMMLPSCTELQFLKTHYIAVIDAGGDDETIAMLGNEESGDIKSVRDSLQQYSKEKGNATGYYYNAVEVMTAVQFLEFINNNIEEIQKLNIPS